MNRGTTWDADHAIGSLAPAPWQGEAWRNHGRRYEAIDPGGWRFRSGRYHRAPTDDPEIESWPALYLSLSTGGALAELMRWIEPTSLAALNNRRLTRVRVSLNSVLDLSDPTVIGLSMSDVIDDHDYALTQAIAAAALHRGVEGLIVPAASLVSSNLVVLVGNLSGVARLEPIDWIDPRLFVDRSPQS